MKKYLNISKKQCAEFGQVATILCLIAALHYKNDYLVWGALAVLAITIILPLLLYPFAILWFALSNALSFIGPVLLLTFVFFVVVTPVGLLRRLFNKDGMKLKQFKKDKRSVLVVRDHEYNSDDLLYIF